MSPVELSAYRSSLLSQLSDTMEWLNRANSELNELDKDHSYSTSQDICDASTSNGIAI